MQKATRISNIIQHSSHVIKYIIHHTSAHPTSYNIPITIATQTTATNEIAGVINLRDSTPSFTYTNLHPAPFSYTSKVVEPIRLLPFFLGIFEKWIVIRTLFVTYSSFVIVFFSLYIHELLFPPRFVEIVGCS